MPVLLSHSQEETQNIAAQFAQDLMPKMQTGAPIFIGLSGDLGAGKSVFARALIQTLIGDPDYAVPSPTFTLVQCYETDHGPIYHYDLYRLADPEDIETIGWEDSLQSGLSLIEWPQRLSYMAPANILSVHIDQTAVNERKIMLPQDIGSAHK